MNGSNSNTSGENQGKFRLKPANATDRIPQWLADELVARGYVIIDISTETNVVIQALEPEDKTKIWFLADANGIPQGSAQIYNALTGKWGPVDQGIAPYVPPLTRFGKLSVAAGGSTLTINFESVKTTNLQMSGAFSTFADGNYAAAPAHDPVATTDTLSWIISGKGEDSVTVTFYAVPTGGLTFEWKVEAIPS